MAQSIAKFVSRMSRPAVTELSVEERDAFRETDDIVFVAYINAEYAASREAYSAVAEKHRHEFTFGLVGNTAAANVGASDRWDKTTPILNFRVTEGNGDKGDENFAEIIDRLWMETYVTAARPKIGELTKLNQQRLLDVSTAFRPLSIMPPCASPDSISAARLAHGVHIRRDGRRARRAPQRAARVREELLREPDVRHGRPPGVSRPAGETGSGAGSLSSRSSSPVVQRQDLPLSARTGDQLAVTSEMGTGRMAGPGQALDASGCEQGV